MKAYDLIHRVTENAAHRETVKDEPKTPGYDNIKTPSNHTSGKKMKTVDGTKGLGVKNDKKPKADVGVPKKQERRKIKMFDKKPKKMSETDSKYDKDAVDKEIRKDKRIKGKEARAIHGLLKGRAPKKKTTEGSKFSDKPVRDEPSTPSYDKMEPTMSGSTRSVHPDHEKAKSDQKKPKLNRKFSHVRDVAVKKVKENLNDLETLLGVQINLDEAFLAADDDMDQEGFGEAYPDDFRGTSQDVGELSDSALQRAMDGAEESMEEELPDLMDMISDAEPEDREEAISNAMEELVGTAKLRTEIDYGDPDLLRDETLMGMAKKLIKNKMTNMDEGWNTDIMPRRKKLDRISSVRDDQYNANLQSPTKAYEGTEPRISLSKNKNPEGEYVVKWIEGGKMNPDKSYYTDDWEDAVATARDMKSRAGMNETKVKKTMKGFWYGNPGSEERQRSETKYAKKLMKSGMDRMEASRKAREKFGETKFSVGSILEWSKNGVEYSGKIIEFIGDKAVVDIGGSKVFKKLSEDEFDIDMETEMQDGVVIRDNPRGGYSVSAEGKYVDTVDSVEKALAWTKTWMKKNQYYPSVFFVNDHGNVSQIDTDGNIMEKTSVSLKSKHKSKKGGLTDSGRKYYNRKTGSNLKRPQPEGGKRKKSYCARSKGQMDMHDIDCREDPDKRICKARRRWDC